MQSGRQLCWGMLESGTGSARSFTSEPGVSQGEEGLAPRASRHEDPEALVFASFFSSFHPTFRSEGGGVLGKRVAETLLPLHYSRDEIVGTPLH